VAPAWSAKVAGRRPYPPSRLRRDRRTQLRGVVISCDRSAHGSQS